MKPTTVPAPPMLFTSSVRRSPDEVYNALDREPHSEVNMALPSESNSDTLAPVHPSTCVTAFSSPFPGGFAVKNEN